MGRAVKRTLADAVQGQGRIEGAATRVIVDTRLAAAFERFDRAELRLCRALNRAGAREPVRRLFRAVSWLGDGWLWYALIVLSPALAPGRGWLVAAQLVATGAAGVLTYTLIKRHAVRERPFITHSVISCVSTPLDRYSFPSGHTLHAVSFTLVLTYHVPDWAPLLVTAAVLIASSRVVLGLHYPSDVAAGAVIGGGLGAASIEIAQEIAPVL